MSLTCGDVLFTPFYISTRRYDEGYATYRIQTFRFGLKSKLTCFLTFPPNDYLLRCDLLSRGGGNEKNTTIKRYIINIFCRQINDVSLPPRPIWFPSGTLSLITSEKYTPLRVYRNRGYSFKRLLENHP